MTLIGVGGRKGQSVCVREKNTNEFFHPLAIPQKVAMVQPQARSFIQVSLVGGRAFPGTSAGSWIGSTAARTRAVALMKDVGVRAAVGSGP